MDPRYDERLGYPIRFSLGDPATDARRDTSARRRTWTLVNTNASVEGRTGVAVYVDSLFTTDKPIIFAYHGYPWLIHRLTYRRTNHHNLHVRGYKEEGTTTTPFDMLVVNDMDRFHLVMDVIDREKRQADLADLEDKVAGESERVYLDRDEALSALDDRLGRPLRVRVLLPHGIRCLVRTHRPTDNVEAWQM